MADLAYLSAYWSTSMPSLRGLTHAPSFTGCNHHRPKSTSFATKQFMPEGPPRHARTESAATSRTSPILQATSQTLSSLQHDEEFWFDDGTVILIVSGVEFRVYKGTMVEHSTVFADMFSLPQPAAAPNGPPCPIVHLDDSPYAWRHVLRVLFPRKGVRYVCRAP